MADDRGNCGEEDAHFTILRKQVTYSEARMLRCHRGR